VKVFHDIIATTLSVTTVSQAALIDEYFNA